MNLPPHQYITSSGQWQACLQKLQSEPQLAIDLEANSMYAYRERVCLIQISIPAHDYIIDPLTQPDLSGLGALIADPAVEKVFHAAEYDLMLLKRQYDWQLNNLFDTMWAARILGYPRYGLANLLDDLFQVKQNKRFQKSNWCKRPLSSAQRAYAQIDTHYLLRLRRHFADELQQAGCREEAREIFAGQTQVQPNNHEFDPDSFWSIQGVRDLNRQQQAILKAINIYRDQEARRRNQPLFKIFSNRTMIELAQTAPRRFNELHQVHGMSPAQVRRHGKQLLRVIESGLHSPPPSRPKQAKRPPDSVLNRYEKLHRWRKERAQTRGVESDVILSRNTLWDIARASPHTPNDLAQIDSLGQWRSRTYGQDILDMLNKKGKRR